LLLILNAYIVYTIFGTVLFYVVAWPIPDKKGEGSFTYSQVTFQKERRNDSAFYFIGLPAVNPTIDINNNAVLKDQQGKLVSAKKNTRDGIYMLPISETQYRNLIYIHVAYSILLIGLFVYLLILLVGLTRTYSTDMFREARNGRRLKRIGILLLVFECLQFLYVLVAGFLPELITGYKGLNVSLNIPAFPGIPYGIIAGLLLVMISDAFTDSASDTL
jgi:hypothetical protein